MKKILIILTIILLTIIWANYLVENYLGKTISNQTEIKKKIEEKKAEIKKKKITKEQIKEKLLTLRKRFEWKWLIQKWDTYLANKQNILALDSYLKFLKHNPKDKIVIKKIGDTYFDMHKYPSAFNYYKKLIGTKIIDNKKIARTYFLTLPKDRTKLNFQEIYSNIEKFKLDKEDTFFYKTAIECVFNKDTCQAKFKKSTQYYSWKNQNLLYIKEAFNNYNSFKVKEQYFLDTQILAALFKAELYPITNILAKDILKEKPKYLPVIKILAKGYFEVWDDKEAKKYLLQFNEINKAEWNPEDVKVDYLLWIININLHEYLLSNIYFNRARKLWYPDETEISRRLIYNYYLADRNLEMIKEFKNLIENWKNLTDIDYSLAIYYALINKKTILANKWVDKALKLYPKNENFYWYKWWILKENWEYEQAEEYLKKWLKINIANPLINLNLWIIEANKGNLFQAKIYFKNTIAEDPNWDFWKFATKQLEKVLTEEINLENNTENNMQLTQ